MRWMSPDSAHWSGSSARRVVTLGPLVTWQSSNSARTVGLARPAKEISYVRDPVKGGAFQRDSCVRLACQGTGAAASYIRG